VRVRPQSMIVPGAAVGAGPSREQLAAVEARLTAADARDAQHVADLSVERAQAERAIAAFASLAERLDALAADRLWQTLRP
jgi:hypothetical protein